MSKDNLVPQQTNLQDILFVINETLCKNFADSDLVIKEGYKNYYLHIIQDLLTYAVANNQNEKERVEAEKIYIEVEQFNNNIKQDIKLSKKESSSNLNKEGLATQYRKLFSQASLGLRNIIKNRSDFADKADRLHQDIISGTFCFAADKILNQYKIGQLSQQYQYDNSFKQEREQIDSLLKQVFAKESKQQENFSLAK